MTDSAELSILQRAVTNIASHKLRAPDTGLTKEDLRCLLNQVISTARTAQAKRAKLVPTPNEVSQ